MIDEHKGDLIGDASDTAASPKLSRRALLLGLFALPIAALDAGPARAQAEFFGIAAELARRAMRGGGNGGGYPYRTRRPPPRQHVHRSDGGSRHASRRSHRDDGGGHASGGGDKSGNGGSAASSATGLGKADY